VSYLRRLLGQETDFIQPPLPPEENVTETVNGSVRGVGGGWGAQLALTPNYLTVNPMNTNSAQRGLGLVAHAAGIHGFGGVNVAINRSKPEPLAIPLDDIVSVSPGRGAGFFSPPTARITTRDGSTQELGVLGGSSLLRPNRSPKTTVARDDLVARLNGLIDRRG
jgi:hypothetical protein